jgi:hypothetical protein
MIYTLRHKLYVSIDKNTINHKEWHQATKPLKKRVKNFELSATCAWRRAP